MDMRALGFGACLALAACSPCLADDLLLVERFLRGDLAFDLKGPYANVTLTVAGPGDFYARAFARRGVPSLRLRDFGPVDDGLYSYELTAASDEFLRARRGLDDGRDRDAPRLRRGISATGSFLVVRGQIVASRRAWEESRRVGGSDRDMPN